MSDPTGVLRSGLEGVLRDDAGVIAAFGAAPVKVYATLPPANAHKPYIFLAGFFVTDDLADCFDGVEVEAQIDVWSLTSPPGFAEAEAIAQAVKVAIAPLAEDDNSPAFALAGFRLVAVQPLSTDYLTDQGDGKTCHAAIRVRFCVDPV